MYIIINSNVIKLQSVIIFLTCIGLNVSCDATKTGKCYLKF